jgi:putative transposase
MTSVTTKPDATQPLTETVSHVFDDWFDPIEAGICDRVREFIEEMIRGELDAVLARPRYGRRVRMADGIENANAVVGWARGPPRSRGRMAPRGSIQSTLTSPRNRGKSEATLTFCMPTSRVGQFSQLDARLR